MIGVEAAGGGRGVDAPGDRRIGVDDDAATCPDAGFCLRAFVRITDEMSDAVAQRVDDVHLAVLEVQRDDVAVVLAAVAEIAARGGIEKPVGDVERGAVFFDLR